MIGKLLVFLLGLSTTISSSGQSSSGVSPDEWRQFRGNASLTGVAASTPPGNLEVLWTYETGDTIDSSAAIANGTVYVGTGNGGLIAVDLVSGELQWEYSTDSFIGESSPALGVNAAYIGDLDGVLHAVRLKDGARLWTFETESEIKSSPILVNDLVLIGSYDTFLYALESETGKLRWKVQTDAQVHATPAVQNGLVFIAGCDGAFRAIRVADGTEAYRIVSGAYTGASPVVVGDRAYFGTFGYEVMALDLNEREILWRYRNPDREFPYYSSATLSDGLLIVGGRDKLVHAIDAQTGDAVWTFQTLARVDSSPVVAGDRVYVGSNDGRLYVFDVATGEKLWEFNAGAALTASPSIAAGRVVIGSTDGVLYCFG